MTLTRSQTDIIKSTAPILVEHGLAITTAFYSTMLTQVPSLNNVFNHANQCSGQQAQALAAALHAYAAHVDDLDFLAAALERISQKHASLGITPAQYGIVGKYLLEAMGTVLGDALTPEILDAWTAAYAQLADVMIKREEELYRAFDGWTAWRDFTVVRKVEESEEVTSFYLRPVDGVPLPRFLPGQYISIQTEVASLKYLQARQYSLSDAPGKDYYRISVKREKGLDMKDADAPSHPGYISNILHDHTEVGNTVQVSHPAGEFFLDVRKEKDSQVEAPVVLLSAGVGLTPLMSMLNTLLDDERHSDRRISWIHATRNSKAQAFGEHVQNLRKSHGGLTTEVFNSNPSEQDRKGEDYDFEGRMDLRQLDKAGDLVLDDEHATYYICGPEGFMVDVEKALVQQGVEAERINMEMFGTGGITRR